MSTRRSVSRGMGLLVSLCVLGGTGCQRSEESRAHEPEQVVARLRAHRMQVHGGKGESRAVLPPAGKVRVERVEGGLTVAPEESSREGSRRGARVVLPDVAQRPFRIQDAHSGLVLDVALEGASAARASVVDGYVVYPSAHPEGGDLLYRFTPEGTEDYLAFEKAPSAPVVRYGLRLGDGVAGLRLVGDTLEVLDGSGAPRLRMAPPYLVGADGQLAWADVSVEGCAVDTRPAAPWGRRVTAPGARQCRVRLEWNPEEVRYPAVLDPVWSTTGSLAEARSAFTTTVLQDGRVLAVGGRTSEGILRASAELYDPATGTWATTGALSSVRTRHSATLLGSGKVLVAGGEAEQWAYTTSHKAELYDPATGTWSLAAPMNLARGDHAASLLADGRVLATGGQGEAGYDLAEAELYDPATDTWTQTGTLVFPRRQQGAEVLSDGRVLVFGGSGGGLDTELYDPATGTWTLTGAMTHTRYNPVSARLADGRVLVATAGAYEAELYDPATGTWSLTGALSWYRHDATASVLPDGRVLVVGGAYSGSGGPPLFTEVYDPATGTWSQGATMRVERVSHAASVLGDGRVLVVGGVEAANYSHTLASAEVLLVDVDDVTAPTVLLTSPADGATLEGDVLLTAEASDDYGVSRVEFYDGDTLIGTATAAPYAVTWYTMWSASNGPHALTARAYDASGNLAASAPITVNVNNDQTAPTVTLTSPAPGSSAQGTITLTAEASDDRGVSGVEFWDGRTWLGSDSEAPYALTWDLTSVTGGPHTLTVRAFDAAGNVGVSPAVTLIVVQPGVATYDSTLRVPRCASVGTQCDSGTYLEGRAHLEPEPNAPNTLGGSCADGTAGGPWDQSLDRLLVYTADGSPLAAGKQVYIAATFYASYDYWSQHLDLYSAADANNPVWKYLTTVTASQRQARQTVYVGYVLPSGALQAVRGRFRYGGSAAPCGTGGHDDHDDLVFAVGGQTGTQGAGPARPAGR